MSLKLYLQSAWSQLGGHVIRRMCALLRLLTILHFKKEITSLKGPQVTEEKTSLSQESCWEFGWIISVLAT